MTQENEGERGRGVGKEEGVGERRVKMGTGRGRIVRVVINRLRLVGCGVFVGFFCLGLRTFLC
jgi:hypothetical protein